MSADLGFRSREQLVITFHSMWPSYRNLLSSLARGALLLMRRSPFGLRGPLASGLLRRLASAADGGASDAVAQQLAHGIDCACYYTTNLFARGQHYSFRDSQHFEQFAAALRRGGAPAVDQDSGMSHCGVLTGLPEEGSIHLCSELLERLILVGHGGMLAGAYGGVYRYALPALTCVLFILYRPNPAAAQRRVHPERRTLRRLARADRGCTEAARTAGGSARAEGCDLRR